MQGHYQHAINGGIKCVVCVAGHTQRIMVAYLKHKQSAHPFIFPCCMLKKLSNPIHLNVAIPELLHWTFNLEAYSSFLANRKLIAYYSMVYSSNHVKDIIYRQMGFSYAYVLQRKVKLHVQ